MKGITPIIAIIILLLITVAVAGTGWSYISMYSGGLMSQQVEVLSSACNDGLARIILKGSGTSTVNTSSIKVVNGASGADISGSVQWFSGVSDSDIVFEAKFDEGSGTAVADVSGYKNNGVFGNGACSPGTGTCPSWSAGKLGNAVLFDSVDDYITAPHSQSLNLTSVVTIAAWINRNGAGSGQAIVQKGQHNLGYYLRLTNFFPCMNVAGTWSICSTYVVPAGQWVHVTVVYNGTDVIHYANGARINSIAKTGAINTGTYVLRIGQRNIGEIAGNEQFNGTIDELRIYSRVLSDSEIRTLASNSAGMDFGQNTLLTHYCGPDNFCKYNLVSGGSVKEAMVQC